MKTIKFLWVMLFSIAVAACGGGGGGGGGGGTGSATPISATATTTAQNLTVGTAMTSFTPLTASDGATPYTYSYTGTLPTGLSFSASTGAVTGTPTAVYAAANLVFSVRDANNNYANTTSTVSFTVSAPAAISATATTTAQNLTVSTAMSSFSPLTASGGTTPYTYSYTGTLPSGLSFSASTGAVTGTPTAVYAAANLVFSVRDANNNYANTTSIVSFTVGAAIPISATATTTAQSLTVGTAMTSFSPLTASDGATPYTYSYTGTLPTGLSFSASTGAVTGTPTAVYAAANLVFSVRDANNNYASTTSIVSFTVGAAIPISATATTTAQNLTFEIAMASFTPLTPSGGVTPYTYRYTGTLPTGLNFNTSTGAVTGTPTAIYATANLVFSVKDANNVAASTTSTVSFTVVNQVSGATTALGSYIADQLNSSFTSAGWWSNNPTSATVTENTLTAGGSPNVYNYTYKEITLTGGVWADSSIAPSYDLASTGWIPSLYTALEVDSGDGTTYFWTAMGEPTVTVTVTKTDLTGTSLPNATGVYPAGSTLYTSIQDIAQYYLWSLFPITDATGTALTALPTMVATFCDTDNVIVFQAITPAPAVGSKNYNAYTTASCAANDISTALLTAPSDTALISIQPTGNSNVPNVILVTGLTTNSGLNDTIYGLRAGKVWAGNTYPAGYTWAEKNKTAINADLIDSSYISVP
jgi:Putative Ig domain